MMRPQRPVERKRRATDSDVHISKASLRVGMSYPLPNEPFPTLQINEHPSATQLPKLSGPIVISPLSLQPGYQRKRRQSHVPPHKSLTDARVRRVSFDKPISDREIRQTRQELRQIAEETRARKIAMGNVPDWANDRPLSHPPEKLRKELVPLRSLKDFKVIEQGWDRDMTHVLV